MSPDDEAAEGVELRAFRGTQRSAVYRSHVVGTPAMERILAAAAHERLPVLGQLRIDRQVEIERTSARQLANELGRLRQDGALVDLDADLTALAEVANWCARSRETAGCASNSSGRPHSE